jgi:hypothetical protein
MQRRQGTSQGNQEGGRRQSMKGVYNIVDLRGLRHMEKGIVEGQTATRYDVVEAGRGVGQLLNRTGEVAELRW